MNIALLTAAGTGGRMGSKVPKQFLTVNDIPIVLYTMLNIQKSGLFDELYVICADGWKDFISSYAIQYDISIFKGTVSGGKTRFESQLNGFRFLQETHNGSDIVSAMDANRPLTPHEVFKECIDQFYECDSTVAMEPCYNSMYLVDIESGSVIESVDRNSLFAGQSPETTTVKIAFDIMNRAYAEGVEDMTLSALLLKYHKRVKVTKGSSKNFKITTSDDFAIFKALLDANQ